MNKKTTYIIAVVGVLVAMLVGYLWYTHKDSSTRTPSVSSPPTITSTINTTTEVSTAPKESPEDNDIEITQTYKADVNGVTVIAPVKTTQANTSGTKGIIKQEIDLAPVVNLAKAQGIQEATKEFKKNWEGSIGVGVHKGDVYIPVEIQRNYSADKAISLEVHLDPKDDFKVNGGEVKHVWKF